jgi:hypothetical protein
MSLLPTKGNEDAGQTILSALRHLSDLVALVLPLTWFSPWLLRNKISLIENTGFDGCACGAGFIPPRAG